MTTHPIASTAIPDLAFISQQLFTAILWVDESLHIKWLNPQVEQLLAISRARLLNLSVLALLAPEELGITKQSSDKFSETESNRTDYPKSCLLTERFTQAQLYQQPFINHDYIFDYALSSSAAVLIDYSVTPVNYQDKDYFIIEMWGKDRQSRITDDQRQQQQYDVARHMLRSVAHEVKNPLAGIRGAAQLLERQSKKFSTLSQLFAKAVLAKTASDDFSMNCLETSLDVEVQSNLAKLTEKLHTYTSIIISETDRLTQLISQLLGSNQRANWQLINIHQPLEHVLTLIVSQYPQVILHRDYDLSLPELAADRDQLIQVFLNLINNACESMTEFAQHQADSSYQLQLRIQTRVAFQHTIGHQQHKQVLQVTISDNGGGIESSLIGQIFFPMVTSRASGTGLGLSIVQDIINRHHGMIDVSSKPKQNNSQTCFTLYLPFAQPLS